MRTGKTRLQAEVTFEEGKTYTLQELFNDNNTASITNTPLTVTVEDGVVSVRRKK
nr:MAG TPA: hypothetical protein [Caudoviricetes sp.]